MVENEKMKSMKLKTKIWFSFYCIYFVFMFIFTFITSLMNPLWYDINEFLISATNVDMSWIAFLLTLTFILLGYSIYLFIFHLIKLIRREDAMPHLANKIIPFPFLAIWIAMLIVLIIEAGEELAIIPMQLEIISPFLWLFYFYGIVILSTHLFSKITNIKEESSENKKRKRFWNKKIKSVTYGTLVFLIFASAFFGPLISMPSTIYTNEMPEKPALIGHRGASHLAPENTIAAGELAAKWGAIGWEVDVAISYDGVLFIMHDDNLKRTTDVEEIFPGRENEHVTNFTIAELKQLDAGSWFADQDPFNTIKRKLVTNTEKENYRNEPIPTLEEALNFTLENDFLVDIDYRFPPSNHPFYTNYSTILLTQLNNSGLGKNILMKSTNPLVANMTQVCDPLLVTEILANGYELVNTHHDLSDKEFREYQENEIDVMVYTVDTKTRFSQLWCLEVDYVKTNKLYVLCNMSKPLFSMSYFLYIFSWVGIYFTSIFVIPFYFIYRNKFRKKIQQK